jgi:hypothetical protein
MQSGIDEFRNTNNFAQRMVLERFNALDLQINVVACKDWGQHLNDDRSKQRDSGLLTRPLQSKTGETNV